MISTWTIKKKKKAESVLQRHSLQWAQNPEGNDKNSSGHPYSGMNAWEPGMDAWRLSIFVKIITQIRFCTICCLIKIHAAFAMWKQYSNLQINIDSVSPLTSLGRGTLIASIRLYRQTVERSLLTQSHSDRQCQSWSSNWCIWSQSWCWTSFSKHLNANLRN